MEVFSRVAVEQLEGARGLVAEYLDDVAEFDVSFAARPELVPTVEQEE